MFGNQQPMYGNPYQMQMRQPAQSYYPQQLPAYQPQQQGLIKVTGMEGAKAYPLAPNSMIPLFDADSDVMYVKQTDAGGYPSIQAYRFTPIQETPAQQPEYVTRQEFEELKEAILSGKQPVRKAKQPAADTAE